MTQKTYMAKNRATGQVTGPHSEQYKNDMERNRATWKRHIWTEVTLERPAALPASLADIVKPAKKEKAQSISAEGE
jgi:hypothetical protein